MITYLGMTMPMAFFALISWLKNPYNKNKAEVKVNTINILEVFFMIALSIIVTIIFYFILLYFHTSYLWISTLSITTSFVAVYLNYRRSPYFALVYASNDIVLIVLWILQSVLNKKYICVIVCFIAFLFNDIYGFVSWKKMKIRQSKKVFE